MLSHVRLFAAPWTVAYQAPLSLELSRQEYWSGLHFLLQNITRLHCRKVKCKLFFLVSWKNFISGNIVSEKKKNLTT